MFLKVFEKKKYSHARIPLLSILCTYSFCLFLRPKPNLMWVILYFLIFILLHFNEAEKPANEVNAASFVLSTIYALIIVIDYELEVNGILTLSVKTAVCFAGMAVFFYHALSHIFIQLLKEPSLKLWNSNNCHIHVLPLAALLLFLWLPYFLACFPGNVNSDAIGEIRQQIGLSPLSNHHPIMHQILIKCCLIVGSFFGGIEAGVAVYSIFQMIIMAILFAFCIQFLAKNRVNTGILFFAFIFYAIYPINGFYVVTMYKDIPFAASFLLLIITLIRELRGDYPSLKNRDGIIHMTILILSSFLFCTFRNNGYYAFLIGFLLLIGFRFKQIKRLLIVFLSVLLLVAGYRYLIFDLAGVARSASGEALSLPLQMIGRVVSIESPDLEEPCFQTLGEVIPDYSVLANNYIPDNSDPIKDPHVFLSDVFSASPLKFIKSWMLIGFRYPRTYLDAFLLHTRGYWSPNIRTTTISAEIYQPNDLNLVQNSRFAPLRYSLIDCYDSISCNSVLSVFFSIGLFVMLYLFSAALLLLKKQFFVLCPMLICAVLWLTVIAGPITAFHYFYALAAALPLFLGPALSTHPRGV